MNIKYVGAKFGMPVYEPIGQKPKHFAKIRCMMDPGDTLDVKEAEAHALVALDPTNFCLDSDVAEEKEVVSEDAPAEPKKRRGRPKKEKV